jgi:hypothetical protein
MLKQRGEGWEHVSGAEAVAALGRLCVIFYALFFTVICMCICGRRVTTQDRI